MSESAAKKILLVEDDSDLRDLLARALRDQKYDVTVARDGKSGMKKAEKREFDLILLDLMMPNVDGLEFLRLLNAVQPRWSNSPVIVISNLAYDDAREEALQLGAKGFLVKADVEIKDIVEVVKKYC